MRRLWLTAFVLGLLAAAPGAQAAVVRVTHEAVGQQAHFATWTSPTRLLYTDLPSCGSVGTAHTVNTDGTNDQSGPSMYGFAQYAPGAKRLAYIPLPGCAGPFPTAYSIVTSELDGSGVVTAAGPPAFPNILTFGLAVSADGSRIAFMHGDVPGSWRLHLVNRDGSAPVQVPVIPLGMAFSPDGSKLAVTDGGGVYIVNADGTNLHQISFARGYDVTWSPDGGIIATSSHPGGSAGEGGIWLADPTADVTGCDPRSPCAADPTRQVSSEGALNPTWSPDGSRLAVTHVQLGGSHTAIAVLNRDGSGERDITSTVGDPAAPAWSPDGTKIAFESTQDSPGDPNNGADQASQDIYVTDAPAPAGGGDSDGDGIPDAIDTTPNAPSTAFNDGAGTSGSVVSTGGLQVTLADAPAPDGVKVTVGAGTGQASFSMCPSTGPFTLRLSAGSEAVLTCGSIKAQVTRGTAQVVLGGGLTTVTIPAGVTAKVTANADHTATVQNLGGGSVTVSVDGATSTVAAGATKQVTPVTAGGVCHMTQQNIQQSAKYQALTAKQRATIDAQVTALCQAVSIITPKLSPAKKAAAVSAYKSAVTALASQGWLTQAQATTLKALADSL
jgi:Tol biopolymer transport system component